MGPQKDDDIPKTDLLGWSIFTGQSQKLLSHKDDWHIKWRKLLKTEIGLINTHFKHNLTYVRLQNISEIFTACHKNTMHCQLSEGFALTGCFVFVAVFSFVMQRHDFRLTTLYKYPEENRHILMFTSIVFWNKGFNNRLVHKRCRQLRKNMLSASDLSADKMITWRIYQCNCHHVCEALQLDFAGYQFSYRATDTPMYNTIMIVCVWDKSGPVRITTVVAKIWIFNGYLFVMDIK